MTTYKKLDNGHLQLEIYGEITGDQYVAVGFSTDSEMVIIYTQNVSDLLDFNGSHQGSDSVTECVQYRTTMKTYQSYNTPDHNNKRLAASNVKFVPNNYFDNTSLISEINSLAKDLRKFLPRILRDTFTAV
jgi:hypothetical protein